MQIQGRDGEIVAVDADQSAHPGISYRYHSGPAFDQFSSTTWDANNLPMRDSNTGDLVRRPVKLNIISGPGAGKTLYEFDGSNIEGRNNYVLNAIAPKRMLIATNNLYESFDGGDSLNNLGDAAEHIGIGDGQPLAYGGRLNGVNKPDVFYVGAGTRIFHR